MIKRLRRVFEKNRLWIIVILTLNFIFGVLLWLSNDKAFIYIFPTMVIGSLILYCVTAFSIYKNDLKREEAISRFLEEPTKDIENEIISLFHYEEAQVIKYIGKILRQNKNTINIHKQGIDEYEEYIEAWAHEIKTPLGLMTFVLDNRKEEISAVVYKRLQYVRTKMQEDIERMLYYARLKSTCNDYFFKELSLKDSCIEVIEEYKVILDENEKNIKLTIRDNGIGVKVYDLPFIFEKGFTGEIGEQRKNSTGMGLYLAKQVAERLKVGLEANDNYTDGFEISLTFPMIAD